VALLAVYAYAFGDCLVNSLYAVYEKSASGFAERYLEMLGAGGTKHHAELLAPFGLEFEEHLLDPGLMGDALVELSKTALVKRHQFDLPHRGQRLFLRNGIGPLGPA